MIEFVKYSKEYAPFIHCYQLTNDDLRFTKLPRDAMESSNPTISHILVMDQGQLVTFFSLEENKNTGPFTGYSEALIIRSFSTDTRFQGLGYGQAVFQLLPDFMERHFPAFTELVLAVNTENEAGQALYEKCGFMDTLQCSRGRTGTVNIMRKVVQQQKMLV